MPADTGLAQKGNLRMLEALKFKDRQQGSLFYKALDKCLKTGALNPFLEIDIEKDPRRSIEALQYFAETCKELGLDNVHSAARSR